MARLLRYPASSPAGGHYRGGSPYPAIAQDPNYEPPPPGVEVTVIDDRDYVGWTASAVRIGEIYMTDVRSMVDKVLRKAGSDPIARLNILDHGNEEGMQFGDDWIDTSTLPNLARELSRLRGRFNSRGFVHVQGCKVGNARPLIVALARIFGVPVYAGTGLHNPVYRFNFGDYVRGWPDGGFDADAPRPGPYERYSPDRLRPAPRERTDAAR